MLANFKKRVHRQPPPEQVQVDARAVQQQRAIALAETVPVPGCHCPICAMHHEIDDDTDPREPMHTVSGSHSQDRACSSLPSIDSIIQVLYPPPYLGTTSPFPDPPSYSSNDSLRSQGDTLNVSPMTCSTDNGPIDPLAQDPSLTGVPSQGTPRRRVSRIEPSPPVIGSDEHVSEELEPLPVYSRFDERRPRFPTASDVLGPYPPLPVIRSAAR